MQTTANGMFFNKPQQELRVLRNLQQQGFLVYLPMIQKEAVSKGRLTFKEEPLFKRYLFVYFDQTNSP